MIADDEAPRSAQDYEALVHALARDSANIQFGHPHFQQRLAERNVSMRQVLETLRTGSVIDGPKRDQWGDWRVKLQRRVAGRRVQVVVAVKDDRLDVVTVI
jgi:hypothetical protein